MPSIAQSIYTCRDPQGRMLTSDRPIAECSTRPMRELSQSGVVKREIQAPPTPEQVRQRREAELQIEQEAEQRRLTEARDRALLMTYRNSDALEVARGRQLADLKRDLGLVEDRIKATAKDLQIANADAASASEQNMPVARRRVADVGRVLASDQDLLRKLRGDEARINERFDEDRRRLRRLLGEPEAPMVKQASANPPASPLKPSNPQ